MKVGSETTGQVRKKVGEDGLGEMEAKGRWKLMCYRVRGETGRLDKRRGGLSAVRIRASLAGVACEFWGNACWSFRLE